MFTQHTDIKCRTLQLHHCFAQFHLIHAGKPKNVVLTCIQTTQVSLMALGCKALFSSISPMHLNKEDLCAFNSMFSICAQKSANIKLSDLQVFLLLCESNMENVQTIRMIQDFLQQDYANKFDSNKQHNTGKASELYQLKCCIRNVNSLQTSTMLLYKCFTKEKNAALYAKTDYEALAYVGSQLSPYYRLHLGACQYCKVNNFWQSPQTSNAIKVSGNIFLLV